jgi:hypothetical protein
MKLQNPTKQHSMSELDPEQFPEKVYGFDYKSSGKFFRMTARQGDAFAIIIIRIRILKLKII